MLMPLLLVSLLAGQTPELVDRTLAIVAGRTITLSDARTALALRLIEGAEVDTAVVQRLVDRELMLREVDRYDPPEPAAERIDERLAAARAVAGGEDGLARVLRDGGFAERRLRAWIRDDLRVEAYLAAALRDGRTASGSDRRLADRSAPAHAGHRDRAVGARRHSARCRYETTTCAALARPWLTTPAVMLPRDR